MKHISIRKARVEDLDAVMAIYDTARKYMRANGNCSQWINGYPSRTLIANDIAQEQLYVGTDDDNELVMAFAFIIGEDPTYAVIEDGRWLNDRPYGTIHRLGSNGKYGGMLLACVDYCSQMTGNLRLDTHEDNMTMRTLVTRYGFKRCGIIYCDDGSPRIAYQRYVE